MDNREANKGESTPYSFPNKMGRIFLLSMEEIMGANGVHTILNLARLQKYNDNYPPNDFDKAFPFSDMGQIMEALEEMYGPQGGRGLARRIGAACFRLGIRDLRPILGIADVAFRILPMRMRIKVGFEVLAQMFNQFSDHRVSLGEDEQYFQWIIERCGVCWGRERNSPCCHLAVGLLQEELYWISGGKDFYVEEVSCIATGDQTCTMLIGKHPLE